MYKIIMAFSVVISSFSANAAFIFGNELYQLCTSDENSQFYFQDESECRGYVTGVYDRLTGTAKKWRFMSGRENNDRTGKKNIYRLCR